MLTGRAIAGPCAGSRLSAPPNWDGRVAVSRQHNTVTYHPGAYRWRESEGVWRWEGRSVPVALKREDVRQVPVAGGTQRCCRCKQDKGQADYIPSRWGAGGQCRACTEEYKRAWRRQNLGSKTRQNGFVY